LSTYKKIELSLEFFRTFKVFIWLSLVTRVRLFSHVSELQGMWSMESMKMGDRTSPQNLRKWNRDRTSTIKKERQGFPLKLRHKSTRLQGVTAQNPIK
jgi:hypothetical protein